MIDNDTVVEAPYCVVCRRSSAGKWRNHVFSRGHQQTTQAFLRQQLVRLQTLCNATTTGADWWRCVFCDVTLPIRNAIAHFGSEAHRKQVEAFCRHHRCDADRQVRPQLWLNATKRRQLEIALNQSTDRVEGQKKKPTNATIVDQATHERVEAFLSSAASRLQEAVSGKRKAVIETPVVEGATQKQQQDARYGPQLALAGGRRLKTVTSFEGVLQNPLGRHDGKRVWGGGIVKVRKTDWIPWAIDQFVKDEQVDRHESLQRGVDNASLVHRVTELAQGEGLSAIAAVPWGSSVGNVHSAAVPPWMVQTEEEYKTCNRRKQVAPPPLPTEMRYRVERNDEKRRDIFSELDAKSKYGPDWLPNFGGVWQEGSRLKTKQAFKNAAVPQSSRQARHQTKGFSTFPSRAAATVPLETIQPPAVLSPGSYVSVPVEDFKTQRRETPNLLLSTSIETNSIESKQMNTGDAKKQLLLAQKERLRAKMAARKRK